MNYMKKHRTIVGWDEINGYRYNNSRNYGNRYVEYPDEITIEKVREREYKIPLNKKLYKELCAEAQRRAAEVSREYIFGNKVALKQLSFH